MFHQIDRKCFNLLKKLEHNQIIPMKHFATMYEITVPNILKHETNLSTSRKSLYDICIIFLGFHHADFEANRVLFHQVDRKCFTK